MEKAHPKWMGFFFFNNKRPKKPTPKSIFQKNHKNKEK